MIPTCARLAIEIAMNEFQVLDVSRSAASLFRSLEQRSVCVADLVIITENHRTVTRRGLSAVAPEAVREWSVE
jgi:hypothetical protein